MTEDLLEIVSNTADGAVAIDREQRIVLWNEAAEALLGFSAREACGRPCYEVMCGRDDAGGVVCQMRCLDVMAALRQERVPTHEIQVRTKAGREVWLSVSSVLVPPGRRSPCILVHLFRDITRQKELEHGVRQLLSSLAQLPPTRDARPPAGAPLSHPARELTRRERQVLSLLASGASTKAIARRLSISPLTARNHIQSILGKLGVHSQLEAVAFSLRNGLV